MEKLKIKVQNDILYLFLILFVTEIFNSVVMTGNTNVLLTIGILGLLLLETWFIRAFSIYSGKKISKYSDVIINISLKERFFGYFILPAIFYISLLAFLFFNRNVVLGHFVLGVSMVLFLILFLNVKSSLNKIYKIENITKIIFDFLCISILYLLINIFVRIGMSPIYFLLSVGVSSFTLLLFILKLHEKMGLLEIVISFLSAIFITCITQLAWNLSIFTIPAVGALAFYLIISIWNIRFSGKVKIWDYILPFIYVIVALTLILNL